MSCPQESSPSRTATLALQRTTVRTHTSLLAYRDQRIGSHTDGIILHASRHPKFFTPDSYNLFPHRASVPVGLYTKAVTPPYVGTETPDQHYCSVLIEAFLAV